jgi:hypothetical protein
MNGLYFFFKGCIGYALRLFFRKVELVEQNKQHGGTIYVSNHASSFMDPLVVGVFRKPIVHFLTRSDVFTPLTKPLLKAVHMLPIYRQHDGLDTKEENNRVFIRCSEILGQGGNLLIFGEGFTDDTFVRRLKPIKKGAIRIGFIALEHFDWQKNIYIASVGCNYTNPGVMRSEVLISANNQFCLNDYKADYLANPNKTITDLTKRVETMLQDELTHVEQVENTSLHEHIMCLTTKGMQVSGYDSKLSLKERWEYSKQLAIWLNKQPSSTIQQLTEVTSLYFKELSNKDCSDDLVLNFRKNNTKNRKTEIFILISLFPLMVLGMLHCLIPYLLVKRFVERSFKRKVFWSSVKMLLGMIVIGLVNIPVIFLVSPLILGITYYLSIGFLGLAAYNWVNTLKSFLKKGKFSMSDYQRLSEKRKTTLAELQHILPKEYF